MLQGEETLEPSIRLLKRYPDYEMSERAAQLIELMGRAERGL